MVLAYLGLGLTRMAGWGADSWVTTPPGFHRDGDMIPVRKRGTKNMLAGAKQRASTVHCFQPFDCLVFSHTYAYSYAIKKDTLH